MRALIFIQKLKQALLEIEANDANHIFFVEPNYKLIQRIKAYALSKLQKVKIGDSDKLRYFTNDLLSRDIFNLRIRYCIVKLREFSIEEGAYCDFIKKAIDLFLENDRSQLYSFFRWPRSADTDYLLALEIAKCFEASYRPEDLFLVDFAQDHQLILSNPQRKSWTVSNLGNYFLQMHPFEAIAFLCAIEIVLTMEYHQTRFISRAMLDELLRGHIKRKPYPYSLSLFGIIRVDHYHDQTTISDFGYRVLSYIKANLEQLQDLILFLLESETTGFKYEAQIDFEELLAIIKRSKILIDDQKKSIQNAIRLYNSGNYLDSLRVIYPVLEGTLDSALRFINLRPSDFRGMKAKVEKLENEGFISSKMSTGLEIFSSRNKVLHGNILEDDIELVRPLFSLVLAYLKSLVIELDTNIGGMN